MIGMCQDKDMIRLADKTIVIVKRTPNIHRVKAEGEFVICHELVSGKKHLIKYDTYITLIDLNIMTAEQYNPTEANIFADFLEENGHQEAANLLRKEFPLLRFEDVPSTKDSPTVPWTELK